MESNIVGELTEASSADHKVVLADKTLTGTAHTAASRDKPSLAY
jgi:hypothetical protein